jgi:hypothetical protein
MLNDPNIQIIQSMNKLQQSIVHIQMKNSGDWKIIFSSISHESIISNTINLMEKIRDYFQNQEYIFDLKDIKIDAMKESKDGYITIYSASYNKQLEINESLEHYQETFLEVKYRREDSFHLIDNKPDQLGPQMEAQKMQYLSQVNQLIQVQKRKWLGELELMLDEVHYRSSWSEK